MNKFRFIILSTCCLLSLTIQAQKIKIKTGIEVLKEQISELKRIMSKGLEVQETEK